MKLRISSCKTAFVKDLTRFAPAWILYLVGMVLVLFTTLSGRASAIVGANLGKTIDYLSVVNLLYAALCAQLLFGDLFQSRLCNALHAMPLKRVEWFFCHVAAGLCFSLVPNAVIALGLFSLLGEFWFVSLFWMAAMTLEFIFFFGLAVLSMLCTGNRFAMVAVYGILNFLSILVLWFIKTVFEPLIYGFYVSSEPFALLSPVVHLAGWEHTYVCFEKISGVRVFTGLGDGWGYLLIIAGVGLALGLLALLLYRRRALETAGDFIAVRPLAPVFCVVYTLTVAAVFAEFGNIFTNEYLGFFVVGFFVGYFTAQMLLRRTVKVFTGRVFLGCAVFAVALFASVGLTKLDPAGYAYWVPDPEQVKSVALSDGYDHTDPDDWLQVESFRDIEAITQLHRDVTEKLGKYPGEDTVSLSLRYTLKNGRQVTRVYEYGVPADGVKEFFSRAEYVLGYSGNFAAFRDSIPFVEVGKTAFTGEQARQLLDAIAADCAEGTMAQNWSFHLKEDSIIWIAFQTSEGEYRDVIVFACAKNTAAWLKEHFELWAYADSKLEEYFPDP